MRALHPWRPLLAKIVAALTLFVGLAPQGATPARPADSPAHRTAASAPAPVVEVSQSVERVPDAPAGTAWSGFAFDACRAPSQRTMDRWRAHSPFIGVGIYIGGALRACEQRHLTRRWVSRQLRSGWKLLPLWVGPQASCTGFHRRIDSHQGARGLYPGARRQGIRAARGAGAAARTLGIPRGTTLWYDIEPFSTRSGRCRRSALRFLSSWTREVHRRGYRSGVYSTLNAAIDALAHAPARGPRGYASPDHVWFAWVNHRADTWLGGRRYVNRPGWKTHRRAHQYALDVAASYGGIRMHIDRNFVDLGRPVAQARVPGPCGREADLRRYPSLRAGATGSRTHAAKCLLRQAGHAGPMAEAGFGKVTREAVRTFQRARRLPATGRTDRATWTALLATGSRPVVKRGSVGAPVRRVQRALNAALPGSVPVDGFFGGRTAAAVRRYQHRVGHPVTGVVAAQTWNDLRHGRLTRPHHRSRTHGRHHHGKAAHHARHRAHHAEHKAHHGRHARHRSHRKHHRR